MTISIGILTARRSIAEIPCLRGFAKDAENAETVIFSFAAETPANENKHVFGLSVPYDVQKNSDFRTTRSHIYSTRRDSVFAFLASQQKGKRILNPLRSLRLE